MALMNCPECGKEVSDTAKKCPHCGYKLSKGMNKMLLIVLIVAGCLLILAVVLTIIIIKANNKKTASNLNGDVGGITKEEANQGNGKKGGASVTLSPNLGVTFSATGSNQNLDGVYNIYLSQDLPLVITNEVYGSTEARVTINKIEYYTSLLNENDVLQYGTAPVYALYYSIEYDYEDLNESPTLGSSFYINCVYYDHNGNIQWTSMIQFDGKHNGKLTGREYDSWLPLDTYKVEFSDYY